MSHILQDRVLQQTTTTGTGDITLGLAVQGFRAIADVCAVGDTMPYFIEAIDDLGQPTGDYEYGIGTFATGNKLQRTTVQGSSNAGALVVFSSGTKNVGIGLMSSAIQAGSNANGKWMRHANGVLEQWGTASGVSNVGVTINMPLAFVSADQIQVTAADGGAPENYAAVYRVSGRMLSANQATIGHSYASGTLMLQWRAIGRWIA